MERLFIICAMGIFLGATVIGANNIALNKPVWTNAESNWVFDGNPASNAVDGDLQTNWNTGVIGSNANPLILMVDLEDIYLISRINLYADSLPEAGRFISYNLLSSTDQSSWMPINSGDLVSLLNPRPQQIDCKPISMRYLRYEVVGGTIWAHLYEIEIYEVPEPCTVLLLGLGGVLIRKR